MLIENKSVVDQQEWGEPYANEVSTDRALVADIPIMRYLLRLALIDLAQLDLEREYPVAQNQIQKPSRHLVKNPFFFANVQK